MELKLQRLESNNNKQPPNLEQDVVAEPIVVTSPKQLQQQARKEPKQAVVEPIPIAEFVSRTPHVPYVVIKDEKKRLQVVLEKLKKNRLDYGLWINHLKIVNFNNEILTQQINDNAKEMILERKIREKNKLLEKEKTFKAKMKQAMETYEKNAIQQESERAEMKAQIMVRIKQADKKRREKQQQQPGVKKAQ